MNKTLKKLTEEWLTLERKTIEQRKTADEFYDMNLMPLIVKDYYKRNISHIYEKAEYLIMSVGRALNADMNSAAGEGIISGCSFRTGFLSDMSICCRI